MGLYDAGFYDAQIHGSSASASIVVPIILQHIPAKSVCDVGCGLGTWLREYARWGIEDYLGIDGEYVSRDALLIPEANFKSANLENAIVLDRKFDLVTSLEVAEHISSEHAHQFVRSLTALADVIAFSAAIPMQGGAGHVNEQWPEYWADMFANEGFGAIDAIRPLIWNDNRVENWYRQNLIIYCRHDALARFPRLAACGRSIGLNVVHPERYTVAINRRPNIAETACMSDLLSALPAVSMRALRSRIGRVFGGRP